VTRNTITYTNLLGISVFVGEGHKYFKSIIKECEIMPQNKTLGCNG